MYYYYNYLLLILFLAVVVFLLLIFVNQTLRCYYVSNATKVALLRQQSTASILSYNVAVTEAIQGHVRQVTQIQNTHTARFIGLLLLYSDWFSRS